MNTVLYRAVIKFTTLLCVSTLPDKTKTTLNSTFWRDRHSVILLNSKSLWAKRAVFLQVVFKISTFCTDKHRL